jgi:NAD(P)-dependent dehydrogenase (short-subunit alcohol dehydrogenase family)
MTDAAVSSRLGFRPGDMAVVTGAASGIGRASAELLAAEGLAVVCWDIDGDRLAAVAAGIRESGAIAHAITCDVADADAVSTAWDQVRGLGDPRYLVNNAGPPSSSGLSVAEGLVAAAASMSIVGDAWLACGDVCEAMTVTSSIAGTWAAGGTADWYPMSKAAIAAYGRQVAAQHGGRPRANIVQPGLVATPRMTDFVSSDAGRALVAHNPLGRAGRADEIAAAIAFLLSPMASYINGATLVVDGGSVI